MICNKCGSQLPEGSKFCQNCGASFEADAGYQQPPPAPVQAPAPQPQYQQPPPQPQYQQPPPPPQYQQPPPQPQYQQPPPPPQYPQQQSPYASPPYAPAATATKSKTGLIIGIAAAVVVVAAIVVVLWLFVFSSGSDLVGEWEYSSGTWVYFFGYSDYIEFFSDGRVIEYDYGEAGRWSTSGSQLTIVGDYSGTEVFTYNISGNTLNITDRDGDTIVYRRTR